MIIGKIDYINLLPFYVFLKKRLKTSAARAALGYYKDVPSAINRAFAKGRIEAAVISSVVSGRYRCSDFGIVADKRVLSVLVCPGEQKDDSESNTSNVLAKILDQRGVVLIGDKALLRSQEAGCKDLASLWYERFGLPFVFARFCHRKNHALYDSLAKEFLRSKPKIPHYILKRYAARSGLSIKQIKNYLRLIRYDLGIEEQRSLKKFLQLAKS